MDTRLPATDNISSGPFLIGGALAVEPINAPGRCCEKVGPRLVVVGMVTPAADSAGQALAKVSPPTTRKVYKRLEDEGLAVIVPGRGVFVAEKLPR